MRIRVREIEEATKECTYEESTSDLNALLGQGPVRDYEFSGSAQVQVWHYRAGQDLFIAGEVISGVVGHCARCLDDFSFSAGTPFSFVLVPRSGRRDEEDLKGEEIDVSYYEGEEIDLSPLLHERILLALPTTPVCQEGCKGLCPKCGANLNRESCGCTPDRRDPRLAAIRNLKPRR